jgi:UDP-4-amino-4,6-dideoxy-N-acetyl-beta-L-altrosamine transaminase
MIPYGKQFLDDGDYEAVLKTLKSDFLTTGPKVEEFEEKFAKKIGADYAISVSNGTAALHLSCLAIGLKKGEEILTSPMTFAASANCALYCGAEPKFTDINEQGLIDEEKIGEKINKKTKAIIPIHYSGLSCNLERIKEIADENNLFVIEDAAHALGSKYNNTSIGKCNHSDMAIFSFHPVKHITTGEGGMITTNSKKLYEKLILLRSHGITKRKEYLKDSNEGPWHQEMQILGFNYRLSDIQCALGISQLSKLDGFVKKRRGLAKRYDGAFKNNKKIGILKEKKYQYNAYHLYPILLENSQTRLRLFEYLKEKGIMCQVHYLPVYLHPYYKSIGYEKGIAPNAEKFYEKELSIPLYSSLTFSEQDWIIDSINEFFNSC